MKSIPFNLQGFKRETRFAAKGAANDLVQKIEEASKPLGFDIQKKNYKVMRSCETLTAIGIVFSFFLDGFLLELRITNTW